MVDIAQKIMNYYINNPPFEISATLQATYIELLTSILENSLIEYSENFPITSEKTFTTASDAVKIDIYETIDEDFMDSILLVESTQLPNYLYRYGLNYNNIVNEITSSEISILNFVSFSDKSYLIEEWANAKKEWLIMDDVYIKVKPSTEYYVMYYRYRTQEEIQKIHQRQFTQLFDINMMQATYGSKLFASEGGIKSVSLSGLSVSFNVPDAQTFQGELAKKKQDVLDSMIDFNDCVESF